MKFNLHPNKQAQEVHFSNRTNKDSSLSITFNNSKVETISQQKHLGLILHGRLNFNKHLESNINKCYIIVGFLKSLSNKLPCDALLIIYKFFVRSHPDYNEIANDNPIMSPLQAGQKQSSIRAAQKQQVSFKVHPVNAFTRNLVWNTSVIEDGFVSLLFSIKQRMGSRYNIFQTT